MAKKLEQAPLGTRIKIGQKVRQLMTDAERKDRFDGVHDTRTRTSRKDWR